MVAQFVYTEWVGGSNPSPPIFGKLAEWSNAIVLKTIDVKSIREFESLTFLLDLNYDTNRGRRYQKTNRRIE